VRPDHRHRGVEPWLLSLIEARAAEHAAAAARDAEVHLRMGAVEPDVDGHALLESSGFASARHFWKMAVRLSPPVARPVVPEGISIRAFDPADMEMQARALFGVHVEGFAGHWGWVAPTYADWRVTSVDADDFDPGLCFLAWDGDDAVGEAFCHVSGGEGHVSALSVRPDRRGRGIGGVLLRWAFAAFAQRDLLDVTLEVDSGNATGAVALYERAGMHVKRRYDIYERVLVGSGPDGARSPSA
jgi:mycothiol synthase